VTRRAARRNGGGPSSSESLRHAIRWEGQPAARIRLGRALLLAGPEPTGIGRSVRLRLRGAACGERTLSLVCRARGSRRWRA
jgi:hypothetical protein